MENLPLRSGFNKPHRVLSPWLRRAIGQGAMPQNAFCNLANSVPRVIADHFPEEFFHARMLTDGLQEFDLDLRKSPLSVCDLLGNVLCNMSTSGQEHWQNTKMRLAVSCSFPHYTG